MTEKDQKIYKLQDQLVAISLSPGKLLVYWQLQDEKVQFICEYFYIPEDQVIKGLRLIEHGSSRVLHEVILRQGVSSWVFKGIKPTGNYYVELGVKRSSETFLPLLKSNSIIQDGKIQLTAGQPPSPGWVGKVSTYTYYENLEGSIFN
ncbi:MULTISPECIES: DUF4912 domain-containing protein [unclassified Bacillus (in: firmicutes)]|uniref:DUF4912 domain-containing protein n=1 Tax=unclassified Bacillus (in: firmicutes) TaxID=185979 RepID=UPI001BE69034|nr:DUF4912 domain-containing protein [Bacillus sp. ISL-39]MBT2660807.1 DUF4912 domain-containing protein [Bacillus sp. ISL-45]